MQLYLYYLSQNQKDFLTLIDDNEIINLARYLFENISKIFFINGPPLINSMS